MMRYDLVFEGGGAKGMVFVGAMQEFEAHGNTRGRLLGTSAGAITATLLAADYSSDEMLAALEEKEDGQPVFMGFMGIPGPFTEEEVKGSALADFVRALDVPGVPDWLESKLDQVLFKRLATEPKYRHLYSIVEKGGWFTAHRFVTWIERKLDSGQYHGQPRRFGAHTLKQFHDATGVELSLVASDTSGGQILVLNHRTAPDLPVKWAVRMSMSIPFVWPEVEWQPDWGQYRGKDMAGHLVVDGGMLSNFPLELLVSRDGPVTDIMGEERGDDVIGLLIDERLDVADAPPPEEAKKEKKLDLGGLKSLQRVNRLVDTMTQAHDKEVIEALEELVARMPAKGYGTTEFGMSEARRAALVAAGRQAMKEFLARRTPAPSELGARGRGDAQPRGIEPGLEGKARGAADRLARGILGG